MKLRTFESEPLSGKITTDPLASTDGGPVLLVNEEPFFPEEAEFFLESAIEEELEMLEEGGYDLPPWEEHEESDAYLDSESLEPQPDDF
jgi:hypothetical protein